MIIKLRNIFLFIFIFSQTLIRGVDITTSYKELSDAVEKQDLSKIKSLLDKGVNINQQGGTVGDTALHRATLKGYFDIVKFLILNGANTNIKNYFGRTPLHYASLNNDEQIVNFLIQNKANVNAQDHKGVTSLHLAAYFGFGKISSILITNGADVKVKDYKNKTAGDLAEFGGRHDLAQLLKILEQKE